MITIDEIPHLASGGKSRDDSPIKRADELPTTSQQNTSFQEQSRTSHSFTNTKEQITGLNDITNP